MFQFSMPFLSKYVFYIDGTVQSRHTGVELKMHRECYALTDDNGEREYVKPEEIIAYGFHLEVTETKRQYLYRILYDRVLKPNCNNNTKSKQHADIV